MIERKHVNSSNVKTIGYDPRAQELHVEFHSGPTHAYEGVRPVDYVKLKTAQSIGAHFHQHIRDNFKSRKL